MKSKMYWMGKSPNPLQIAPPTLEKVRKTTAEPQNVSPYHHCQPSCSTTSAAADINGEVTLIDGVAA
jgi:hypothetical protein